MCARSVGTGRFVHVSTEKLADVTRLVWRFLSVFLLSIRRLKFRPEYLHQAMLVHGAPFGSQSDPVCLVTLSGSPLNLSSIILLC